MAGLFGQQSLPTSDETGLSEAVTKEANTSVEKILEEKRGGEKGRKRKYTHAFHT